MPPVLDHNHRALVGRDGEGILIGSIHVMGECLKENEAAETRSVFFHRDAGSFHVVFVTDDPKANGRVVAGIEKSVGDVPVRLRLDHVVVNGRRQGVFPEVLPVIVTGEIAVIIKSREHIRARLDSLTLQYDGGVMSGQRPPEFCIGRVRV